MEKKTFWMTLGFIFGSTIALAKCSQIYRETSPILPNAYSQTSEWGKFNSLCKNLCSPDETVIIGEPIPGRVDEDTYCICAGDSPRVAATWMHYVK